MALKFRQFRAARPFYGGRGVIAGESPGLVTVGGVPAARRVRVFEQRTGKIVAETVSAADGTYRIEGLNPALEYMVVGVDHEKVYNAGVMDRIKPVVE